MFLVFVHHFTANQEVLNRVEVEYETLPGWKSDTSNARTFNDLPANAKKYVHFVEESLGIPIGLTYVGSS
ncbi:unnamed protein product [Ranitomeya imitator]|uniref:Adenylosuccinate synthetase n=1 Tax=Ranitomeya imitator TaxID=111125 RepID=A0ABN9KZW8_9NEOB|nr:unnamed protein product [Ranitomeya imitator]